MDNMLIFVKLAYKNKELVEKSDKCGCYYCNSIISPSEVEYLEEVDGPYTAICPKCGMDTVLDNRSIEKYQKVLNKYFLEKVNKATFNNLI